MTEEQRVNLYFALLEAAEVADSIKTMYTTVMF